MLSLHVNEFVEKPQVENASEFKFEIALSSMASVFLFVFFYNIG
jgi:mannose-1-phosphate guanylyltransferase